MSSVNLGDSTKLHYEQIFLLMFRSVMPEFRQQSLMMLILIRDRLGLNYIFKLTCENNKDRYPDYTDKARKPNA